jgi:hypothetical protein
VYTGLTATKGQGDYKANAADLYSYVAFIVTAAVFTPNGLEDGQTD